MSRTLPMADGLSVSLKQYLDDAIGPDYVAREVSAELLLRDFRATRTAAETQVYRDLSLDVSCQLTRRSPAFAAGVAA